MNAAPENLATRPVRIFLSYKRDVEPDEPLAREIADSLTARGHSVFIDHRLKIGQEWAEEIESRLRQSDYLIVFLTHASSSSEMVKGEIEIARKQAGENGGSPKILPVRVAFAGTLPYPLNAYLDKIQYVMWRGKADTHKLLEQLGQALGGGEIYGPVRVQVPVPMDHSSPPPYAAPLPPPGGALDLEDPWYLDRPDDAQVLSLIRQPGQTIVIKGPRQMGKSSLLMRAVAAAYEAGKRMVLLDFQLLDGATKGSNDLFFRRFSASIAEQLDFPDLVDHFWDPGLANPQNCTRYVEKQILAKVADPLTLAIDEVDALFETAFPSDFFAMLRSWHNNRANPAKRMWRKLDLVLVTSTEPYMLIDRLHESPFNVGSVSNLKDFLPGQVQEMNKRHRSPLFPEEVDRLVSLLSGHPYLTRKAMYVLNKGLTPDELFSQATDDSGPFGDHLRYHLLRLQTHEDLLTALWQIVEGRGCEDESLAYRLEGSGLVKRQGSRLIPRCQLYADYFRERIKPRD